MHTAFKLPILGGLPISESVVMTWVVMAVMIIVGLILTRNLQVINPSKRQLAVESFFSWMDKFFKGLLGEEGKGYIPYLITVIVFLTISNALGWFGLTPPTKDINVTAALSIMSIILIESAGMIHKGFGGWFHQKLEPVPMIAPLNFLEIIIRPLSLCMRLFGNILGAYIIMELLKHLVPVILPVPVGLFFDTFDAVLQAYVFCLLTSLFIKESLE